MKALSISLLISLTASTAFGDVLTQVDREALLEKLEAIRSEADSKVDARFRAAMAAYKSAMSSDDGAVELYLKCEEMVNFEEMNKKSGDFRDWKRNNSDRLSDKDFKMALRQQLRWLVLTLEAASEDPDRDQLAMEAGKILDSIMTQAEDLSAQRNVLEQSVTTSVFARAYDINNIKVENWPLSPVQIQAVYEQVILPPLRRADRLTALKAAWTKRMVNESTIADLWSGRPGEKNKTGVRSPQYDKFVVETLPKRQWESEVDLFKAGDERGAAIRMLAHIEKNLTHDAAPNWAADFISLLQKAPETDSTPDSPGEDLGTEAVE